MPLDRSALSVLTFEGKICSQTGRQFYLTLTLTLELLTSVTIRPPHSGHTQFRIPETTSAGRLIILDLLEDMETFK